MAHHGEAIPLFHTLACSLAKEYRVSGRESKLVFRLLSADKAKVIGNFLARVKTRAIDRGSPSVVGGLDRLRAGNWGFLAQAYCCTKNQGKAQTCDICAHHETPSSTRPEGRAGTIHPENSNAFQYRQEIGLGCFTHLIPPCYIFCFQ